MQSPSSEWVSLSIFTNGTKTGLFQELKETETLEDVDRLACECTVALLEQGSPSYQYRKEMNAEIMEFIPY